MDAHVEALAGSEPPFEILAPDTQSTPLVLASPHSGDRYSAEFMAASQLAGRALRKSEDCFVDEIFAAAPELGAPLIRALFPRAFMDVNREAYELDPEMFADKLPAYVNTRSPRVAAGLGTIARIVANGEEIYRSKLRFADAVERIERYYTPYHAALHGLVERTKHQFGYALLLDCHSMPSSGLSRNDPRRADFVLGDCFGTACAAGVINMAERVLRDLGYAVSRNTPYAGGYTTRHYGQPRQGVHALQIEISRDLYMNEATLERLPFLPVLARHMGELIGALAHLSPTILRPY
jgi:N-formylglutamate amidohydrolase